MFGVSISPKLILGCAVHAAGHICFQVSADFFRKLRPAWAEPTLFGQCTVVIRKHSIIGLELRHDEVVITTVCRV